MMRCSWRFLGLFLLALAILPLAAQGQPSGSSTAPPTEIGGKSVKYWIADIKSRDPSIRQNALRTIIYFGKGARDAGPAIINSLRDRDTSCRVHAALALIGMAEARALKNEDVIRAVEALGYTLNNDAQAIVRFHAAVALSLFGADARPVIPNLVKQVRDVSSWEIRRAVVAALASAGADQTYGPDPRALRALAGILVNPTSYEESSQVRFEAVIGLGSLGKGNNPTDLALEVQAIQQALKDRDKSVVIWAYAALMALDKVSDERLNAVTKHFKGKDALAKVQAARALGAIGREAKSKVPDLVDLLDDKEPLVVAAAISALGEFGANASSALTALNAMTQNKDQNEYLRELAKEAVKKINEPRK
jgi:HEAT repeat protein